MLVGGEGDTFVPVLELRPRGRVHLSRRQIDDVVAAIETQPRSPGSRIAKRAVDVFGSAVGLIVLSPILLLLALAVKLTSRGPILFVQDRCGLGGHRFRFYKFRTMVE